MYHIKPTKLHSHKLQVTVKAQTRIMLDHLTHLQSGIPLLSFEIEFKLFIATENISPCECGLCISTS